MDLKKKPGFYFFAVKTIFLLAIIIIVTSCCPPIWSKMKKRAEVDLVARTAKDGLHILASDNFINGYQNWIAEASGNCKLVYSAVDTCLDIKSSEGLTLWYKAPFEGDIRIRYEVCAVDQGESLDRVSNLDCYWMASDPVFPDSISKRMNFRKGASGRNYSLQLYCMSFGGKSNTVTNFRRFDGKYDAFHNEMKRPDILLEYKDPSNLIQPNHWYTIEVRVQMGHVQYMLDGRTLVDYVDSTPLKRGWFGIRTNENHMRVRKFVAYQL